MSGCRLVGEAKVGWCGVTWKMVMVESEGARGVASLSRPLLQKDSRPATKSDNSHTHVKLL
jgi:hypothetical protein